MRADLHVVGEPQAKKPPEQRPLTVVPGYDMYNKPAPKIPWLVEGLIPKGSIFCLNGRGGIWKSWTFTALALSVATGTKFMDHFRCPIDEPDWSSAWLRCARISIRPIESTSHTPVPVG